jgi:hypothetical protein
MEALIEARDLAQRPVPLSGAASTGLLASEPGHRGAPAEQLPAGIRRLMAAGKGLCHDTGTRTRMLICNFDK